MDENFSFKRKSFNYLIDNINSLILNRLTSRSMKLFFLGGDSINLFPIGSGYHELHIVELIKKMASKGANKFFIDIGSNIGLISSQVGNMFDVIYLFEPNPICYKASLINLELSAINSKVVANNYGLGLLDESLSLYIPKNNWGGAFIKEYNSYDINISANKDGFEVFDIKNYFVKKVELKAAVPVLTEIFELLKSAKRNFGVIKIDVEGLEKLIIKSIAKAIPRDISCYIIFESWDPQIDMSELVDSFDGRATGFKYIKAIPKIINRTKFLKALYFAIFNYFEYKVHIYGKDDNCVGDLIIKVEALGV